MKKIWSTCLLATLVLGVSACGRSSESSEANIVTANALSEENPTSAETATSFENESTGNEALDSNATDASTNSAF